MIGPIGKRLWQRLPGGKIDHIGGAGGHDLGDAGPACIFQPVGAGGDHRAVLVIDDLLHAEIEHGGKAPLGGDRFKRPAAHAGRVKHRDLIATVFKFRLQVLHVFQAT